MKLKLAPFCSPLDGLLHDITSTEFQIFKYLHDHPKNRNLHQALLLKQSLKLIPQF